MRGSATLQRKTQELWTTRDLAVLFNRTPMTIYLWRRDRGLPAVVIKGAARPAVRFIPADVRAWASRNGYRMRKEAMA